MFKTVTSSRFKNLGFSLLELSVVFAIIGIIAGSLLQFATNRTHAMKIKTTHEKLDRIERALADYVIVNGRLPCPARGDLPVTNTAFGEDDADCAATGYNIITTTTNNIRVGVVPTRALDLADEDMMDAWGGRITYAVDRRFANQGGSTFAGTNNGQIYVSSGGTSSNFNKTANGVYVLISHGINGHCSWISTGSATRLNAGSLGADEDENCHLGDEANYNRNFNQQIASDTFDDIVRYKVKWQVLSDANLIIPEANCDIANAVNAATGATVCGGSPYSNCTTIVNALEAQVRGLCF